MCLKWNLNNNIYIFGQQERSMVMVEFFINPYKMIWMKCPATGKAVMTGINSLYFEEWDDNPPKDGASFTCPVCSQKHTFDKTNTWLEDIGKR
jgi:hypothetical protein